MCFLLKILNTLKMQPIKTKIQPKTAREEKIFKFFLKYKADFAGEKILNIEPKHQVEQVPDIICSLASGKRIGIELTEWLIQSNKKISGDWGKLISKALMETKISIHPAITFAQIDRSDRKLISDEIKKLAQYAEDCSWSGNSYCMDLDELKIVSSILAKYWKFVMLWKGLVSHSNSIFRGKSVNASVLAQDSLQTILNKKADKPYDKCKTEHNLEAIYLLVHYEMDTAAGIVPGYSHILGWAHDVYDVPKRKKTSV